MSSPTRGFADDGIVDFIRAARKARLGHVWRQRAARTQAVLVEQVAKQHLVFGIKAQLVVQHRRIECASIVERVVSRIRLAPEFRAANRRIRIVGSLHLVLESVRFRTCRCQGICRHGMFCIMAQEYEAFAFQAVVTVVSASEHDKVVRKILVPRGGRRVRIDHVMRNEHIRYEVGRIKIYRIFLVPRAVCVATHYSHVVVCVIVRKTLIRSNVIQRVPGVQVPGRGASLASTLQVCGLRLDGVVLVSVTTVV